MKAFLTAALPWVVIGICIALLAVHQSKQKVNKEKKQDKDEASYGNHMTDGMCVGMCMGVAFGTTGIMDLATGISLGMLLGLCVGMCIKK